MTQSLSALEAKLKAAGYDLDELDRDNPYTQMSLDLDDDTPLVCSRDQSSDTTCEACQ